MADLKSAPSSSSEGKGDLERLSLDFRRPLGVVACDTPLKELQETDGYGVAKGARCAGPPRRPLARRRTACGSAAQHACLLLSEWGGCVSEAQMGEQSSACIRQRHPLLDAAGRWRHRRCRCRRWNTLPGLCKRRCFHNPHVRPPQPHDQHRRDTPPPTHPSHPLAAAHALPSPTPHRPPCKARLPRSGPPPPSRWATAPRPRAGSSSWHGRVRGGGGFPGLVEVPGRPWPGGRRSCRRSCRPGAALPAPLLAQPPMRVGRALAPATAPCRRHHVGRVLHVRIGAGGPGHPVAAALAGADRHGHG